MEQLANFIGGDFSAPKNGKYLDNYDPASGEVWAKVPDSDAIDAVDAIRSANEAFPAWSKTSVEERAKILNRIADILEDRIDEFAALESRDVGKPLKLARQTDMNRAVLNFRFFASQILTQTSESVDLQSKGFAYVQRQPLGVAALISPWNLPLYLLTWKLAPCLATGNTAVCKPSEVTPMTAFKLAEVLQEAGLPKGVCNILFGTGPSAGAPLVQHPGVPLVSFTGGTETGRKIQDLAGPHFKKVSLELGGKNANIILKDADLEKALEMTLKSSFLNSGQICLCGSRVFIQDAIYDEFMAEFRKRTSDLVVGDPKDDQTFMGPLVSRDQLEKVQAAVQQAKSEEGRITVGGETPSLGDHLEGGYFYSPTIIEDLTNCSDLWQKEIFGPVVTVQKFKYPHEAVKLANTSSYGLSASLWTKDLTRAHKMAGEIQAGTVWINTWMLRDLRLPFGGMKDSGIGREGGRHSLEFFTEQKAICVAQN